MKRERIANVAVFIGVMLFFAFIFMAVTFQPAELEPDSYEVSLMARSPWWHKNYCDFLRLEISDYVPDGIYVNCR